MIIHLIICCLFLFSFSSPSTIKPLQVNTISNKTELDSDIHVEHNKTKLIIPSEGGSLSSNVPTTLSKDNQSLLLSLDKDQVKNKEKSVVPRKGVKFVPKEDSSVEYDTSIQKGNKLESNKQNLQNNSTLNTNKSLSIDISVSSTEKIPKVHKPLVLSSELLEKDGANIEYEPNVKVKSINENSRPDLIMPIVITILVVPMFAVVGYMAIKRGQEAWKNRHYKRMDFLLDGMYND